MNFDKLIEAITTNKETSIIIFLVILLALFLILVKLKNFNTYQKIKKLKQVIKKYPNFADVRCALGDLYFIDENFKLAIIEYEASIKICPTYIRARLRLARSYLAINELITAYLTYREATKYTAENHVAIKEIRTQMAYIRKKVPPEKIPVQKENDPLDYI